MSDTPKRPTIDELEKILADKSKTVSILPNGEIVVNDRIAELERALTAKEAEMVQQLMEMTHLERERNEAESQLAEARKDAELLKWVRENCRVVYYYPDTLRYPVEHTLAAKKDAWRLLEQAMTDAARIHGGKK
jgi:hypothetical protein